MPKFGHGRGHAPKNTVLVNVSSGDDPLIKGRLWKQFIILIRF